MKGSGWAHAPTTVKAVIGCIVANLVLGVVSLPFALSRIDSVVHDNSTIANPDQVITLAKAVVVVSIVISVALYTWLSIMLLKQRRWAWITLLVFASLRMLSALGGLASQYRTGLSYVAIPFAIATFVVLLLSAVREWVAVRPAEFAGYGAWGGQPGYGQPGYGQPGYGPPPGAYPGAYPGQPGYAQPGQPGYGPPPGAPQYAQPQHAQNPQQSPGWGQPQPPPTGGGYAPPA